MAPSNVQTGDISKAIEMLEGLKANGNVDRNGTARIDSTLGHLGRVFQDLDPEAQERIKIDISVKFQPLVVTVTIRF